MKINREIGIKSLSISILLIIIIIFINIVSLEITEKLNFKYPDRIFKIESNNEEPINWDIKQVKPIIKLILDSKGKEYKVVRSKFFSEKLLIKEENNKEKVENILTKEKLYLAKIIEIKISRGKYYKTNKQIIKQTTKVLKVRVITKEKVFKNIYITLNEANKVLDFKVTIDKKAEEYRELKAYYETLNEANLYKRFSIGLKNKIKNKIIITRSEDFQKVFYFMKRDKKYIIIKKGDVYRLTINKKIVKIEKIKEEETELGYLLF